MAQAIFEVYQGNDKTMYVQVFNTDATPMDLNIVSDIHWVVYNRETEIIRKTLASEQIVIIDPNNGKFRVDVGGVDTRIRVNSYNMVLRLITTTGKTYTVLTGDFVIKSDH